MKKSLFLTLLLGFLGAAHTQTVQLMIKKGDKGLYLEHTVAAKEGLYSVGRLYTVSPKYIASYNHIDMNKGLEIGQVIRIPLTDTNFTQKSTSGTPVYYTIQSGDGLFRLSNEYNKVPVKSLREWNSLTSDNIKEGADMVVGFLISKEMSTYLANNKLKKQELEKQQQLLQQQQEQAQNNIAVKEDKPVTTTTQPVTKTETPITPPAKPAAMDVVMDNSKKAEVDKPVQAVIKEEVKPAVEDGYFKTSFDQQVRTKPVSKNETVTSGVFKTTSGWQDAKYYLLMDGVSPGTIIRIVNPDNNRTVYAKVLGEMNGIRQNQGLDIRISNAAASALAIKEEDKFVVKVNW